MEYPGQAAREKCAERIGAEIRAFLPRRAVDARDEGRVTWMAGRCGACRACPTIVRELQLMAPPAPRAEAEVVNFRLAG